MLIRLRQVQNRFVPMCVPHLIRLKSDWIWQGCSLNPTYRSSREELKSPGQGTYNRKCGLGLGKLGLQSQSYSEVGFLRGTSLLSSPYGRVCFRDERFYFFFIIYKRLNFSMYPKSKTLWLICILWAWAISYLTLYICWLIPLNSRFSFCLSKL